MYVLYLYVFVDSNRNDIVMSYFVMSMNPSCSGMDLFVLTKYINFLYIGTVYFYITYEYTYVGTLTTIETDVQ